MRNAVTSLFAAILIFFSINGTLLADQERPLSLGPLEVMPSDNDVIEVGMGLFNVFRDRDGSNNEGAGAASVEYRIGRRFYYIGFALGAMATVDGGAFVYVGNYADIRFAQRYFLTPVLSLGAYRQGGGKDLGGTFEFRSAVTLSYQMKDKSRLGVRFAHTSNAGIHDENPGANEIYLTYGFSF